KIDPWPPRARRRLRVRPGEQLDVVGLVKRTASDDDENPVKPQHYPSVSRLAADPWLRGVAQTDEGRRVLAGHGRACAALCKEGLLNRVDAERYPQFGDFPFEGSALYRTRHHELAEETLEGKEATELFEQLRSALAAVERHAGDAGLGVEPDP